MDGTIKKRTWERNIQKKQEKAETRSEQTKEKKLSASDLKWNEAQSARAESTHTAVNWRCTNTSTKT